MKLADAFVLARRQRMLRLIDKTGGTLNEDVICTGMVIDGWGRYPRSDFRADIDHLVKHGCLSEAWNDDVRILTLTERGGDAAAGRIEVTGVACDRG